MADVWTKTGDTAPRLVSTLERPPGTRKDISGADVEIIIRAIRTDDVLLMAAANNDQAGAPTMGDVSYDWQVGDTDVPGGYYFEWRVTYADGLVETFRNSGYSKLAVLKNLEGEAS